MPEQHALLANSTCSGTDWALPLPNLPIFLPAETLYSWCGAVHASNGNTHAWRTSEQLFGSRSAALLHDFPSHLDALDGRLEHALGAPKELALRRTLLGYFLPTQSTATAAKFLEAVCVGSAPHLKLQLGISASRVGGHHQLKGCKQCFDEQEGRYGRAYWRVDHQFPSVFVCMEHDRPLLTAWDSVTPVHRCGFVLPRLGLSRQWREPPPWTPVQARKLRRLAEFSRCWASLEPAELQLPVLAATYRASLQPVGMATRSGNLRLSKVVPHVLSHYRGLDSLPGMSVLSSLSVDWPGLIGSLARRAPRHAHPLKHLVLIAMLFESWTAFCDAYQERLSAEVAGAPDITASTAAGEDERLLRFKRLVIAEGLSVTAAAARVGVSTTTGVQWAKRSGISFTPRPKTLASDKVAQVRALLAEGVGRHSIFAETGASLTSINRIASAEPHADRRWKEHRHEHARAANRTRFMHVVRSHPDWTVKQIRSAPGNGYMWLYRNDRQWLLEHLPSLFQS